MVMLIIMNFPIKNGGSKPIVFCEGLPEGISPYIHLNIPTSPNWAFPEIGLPPNHHPLLLGILYEINYPAMEVPH